MMLPQVLLLLGLTCIPLAISDPGAKVFLSTKELLLDPPQPSILASLKHLSDKETLADLRANIRRQRQIRFKSSYQQLPAGLKKSLKSNGIDENLPNLSYFIQVDVNDPPASTALTTIPEGSKTYFPPQVSQPGAFPVKVSKPLPKPRVAFTETTTTLQIVNKDQESSTSHQKASSPQREDQRTISNSNRDFDSVVSVNSHATPSNFIGLSGLSLTSPQLLNNSSDLSSSIAENSQSIETQEVADSSYVSYTASQTQPTKFIETPPSKTMSSSSLPPSLGSQTSSSRQVNPGSSFSSSTSSAPLFTNSFPSGESQPTSHVPRTSTIQNKVSGSSTSQTPYFIHPSSSLRQPFNSQQQSKSFPSSFSGLRIGSQQQSNRNPSQATSLTKSQTFQSRPLPKSQTFQFNPSPKPQTFQSNPFPKSQTSFSSLTGSNTSSLQHLTPPTRPYSPTSKSSIKSFSSSSSKPFQANKDSKRRNIGIGKASTVFQSPKDGKTATLVSSDNINTGSIPGRSGSDYPTLQTIPKTGFNCASKSFGGYYADPETNCQVFHVCWGRRNASFLCPVGTLFNQRLLVCDWWYNVDCFSTDAFVDSSLHFWGKNQI